MSNKTQNNASGTTAQSTQTFEDFLRQTSSNCNTETANMDSKDLGIVQDNLYHEALAYKKCQVYSQYLTDPQLKGLASNAAEHHKQHFNAMMQYLNCH